jgi:hypothetical protein
MPTWNRFDIAAAWYLALSHCHGGQGSVEYRHLSRMGRVFHPSPMLSLQSLTENGRQIYRSALRRLRRHTARA